MQAKCSGYLSWFSVLLATHLFFDCLLAALNLSTHCMQLDGFIHFINPDDTQHLSLNSCLPEFKTHRFNSPLDIGVKRQPYLDGGNRILGTAFSQLFSGSCTSQQALSGPQLLKSNSQGSLLSSPRYFPNPIFCNMSLHYNYFSLVQVIFSWLLQKSLLFYFVFVPSNKLTQNIQCDVFDTQIEHVVSMLKL